MQNLKIFVFEDDQDSQIMIAETLKESVGLQVRVYSTPRDFFFRETYYDLIIADWRYEDGVTLAHFLSQIDPKKLIILTGGVLSPEPECIAVHAKLYVDQLPRLVVEHFKKSRSS